MIGYARVHGRRVALSREARRATGKDVLDLLFYYDLAHGQVHNIRQFFTAADLTPQTFNSFYMDDRNIGVFTSGLVPIRPRNVDPDLPINGTGREEWRGFVSFKNHPQGHEPAERARSSTGTTARRRAIRRRRTTGRSARSSGSTCCSTTSAEGAT